MSDELHVENNRIFINFQRFFSSMGKLKRCSIHWDNAGISKGTADVEYEFFKDAERAIEYLNGK